MPYSKVWMDHSDNDVLGLRLTVDVQSGSLLQAALVTLVTAAGTAFWSIAVYVLFRILVRNSRTDALGASTRLLLANPRGQVTDIWTLLKLGLRWHKHSNRALLRCVSLATFGAVLWGGWIAASLFVSRATLADPNHALTPVDPTACGLQQFDTRITEVLAAFNSLMQEETMASQTWVKECYGESPDPIRCTGLPTTAFNYTRLNASCPWSGDRCLLGSNGAWHMSTGIINSHTHLGVNAAETDRVGILMDVTCSVIHYRDVLNITVDPSSNGNFHIYAIDFGLDPGNNGYLWLYQTETAKNHVGYQVVPMYIPAQGINNSQIIPAMNRSDGDLVLAFFTANNVVYTASNQDPFYNASGDSVLYDEGHEYILPDSYVRIMACHQRYQLHNPVNNLNSSMTNIVGLLTDGLGYNEQQIATSTRIIESLLYANLYNSISGLGGNSLLANSLVYDVFSPGLPDNQWIAEIQYWFETGLTRLARRMVDFPTNSKITDNEYITVTDPSTIPGLAQQCRTQLAGTKGLYQTFSFIAIIIIVTFSVALIILSLTLARCVARSGGPGLQAEQGYQNLNILTEYLQERSYGGFLQEEFSIPVRPDDARDIRNPVLLNGRFTFPRSGEMIEEMYSGDDEEGNIEYAEEIVMKHVSAK